MSLCDADKVSAIARDVPYCNCRSLLGKGGIIKENTKRRFSSRDEIFLKTVVRFLVYAVSALIQVRKELTKCVLIPKVLHSIRAKFKLYFDKPDSDDVADRKCTLYLQHVGAQRMCFHILFFDKSK